MEVWSDIKGYEFLYQVSNKGRVRSFGRIVNTGLKNQPCRFVPGKYLTLIENGLGYLQVDLCNEEGKKRFLVHRLVANAFICNSKNLPQVNHINGMKTDNRVCNLEWCDQSHNMKHAYANGLIRDRNGSNNPNSRTVGQYYNGEYVRTWGSISEASKLLNIRRSSISECCNGKRKFAGGYTWKYVNDVS